MIFVYLLLAYLAVRTLKQVARPAPAAPRFVSRAPGVTFAAPIDPLIAWRVDFNQQPEPKAPRVNPLNMYAPPGVTFK